MSARGQLLQDILVNPTNSFCLVRAGDDLDEFLEIIQQHGHHLEPAEQTQLLQNVAEMQLDVCLRYFDVVEASNQGWLRWAYATWTTSAIAHYLGVSRAYVRSQLLEYGIAHAGSDPFLLDEPDGDAATNNDPLLDPEPADTDVPCNGPHTQITNDNLDALVQTLQSHFQSAGVQMSVHNVCIKRLWADVTNQVGHIWSDLFYLLELRHGLDINNHNHIWLLQHLFLPTINNYLSLFTKGWNNHTISIVQAPKLHLTDEELEVYGLDWDALGDTNIRDSQAANNPQSEDSTSWFGRTGPPPNLSKVHVNAPETSVEDNTVELV
ncbi:hypothetical protein C8J56DRAFT_1004806 [Mycena floridula]|nr:hypothetical protein C8J56DRAFT_1004806 [Mycena floridula]